MIEVPTDVARVLDVLGILAFALSGGLAAVRARLDLFGVLVLAWATGLGGGIMRDVLLGDVPPPGISEPLLIVPVLVAGLLVFAFHGSFVDLTRSRPRLRLGLIGRSVTYLDAVGLATFTVAATVKAISLGAPPFACMVVAVVTATGGGVVRDVLVGRVPEVLRRDVYAVLALGGAGVLVLAHHLDALTLPVVVATMLAVLALRIAAIHGRWNIPLPRVPSRAEEVADPGTGPTQTPSTPTSPGERG